MAVAPRIPSPSVLRLQSMIDSYHVLSQLPVMVWQADCDGTPVQFNQSWLRFRGTDLQAELRHGIESAIHPDDRVAREEQLSAAIASQSTTTNEYRLLQADGSYRWIEENVSPCFDEDGRLLGYTGACHDVTQRRESLENARLSEKKSRAVFDQCYQFIGLLDCEGRVLEANHTALKFSGIPFESVRHKYFWDTPWWQHNPELQAKLRDTVELVNRTKEYVQFECTHPDAEGQTHHIQFSLKPVLDDRNEVLWLVPEGRDVTALKDSVSNLSDIKTALDVANDCVFIFDAQDLHFVYVNQGAIDQIGFGLDELSRMTPVDIKPDFDEVSFREMIAPLFDSPDKASIFRTRHQHRDGSIIPVEISLKLIPELGEGGRFVAIVRDISAQLAVEQSLRKAKEQAEASSRAKSEFLANMSHEIRTPMTAILGYSELLAEEWEDPSDIIQVGLETINSNAISLLTIINDILDVSKIEAGQMQLEHIEFPTNKVVDEVAQLLQPRAESKGIELSILYHPPLPSRIMTDPTRLRQILMNIVGNAIKFTEAGRVTVHVEFDPNESLLQFHVVDTGIGMTQEQCDQISKFEAFTQADTSTTRRFGGSGLGLCISAALVKKLGGQLQIQSHLDAGTTISFTISAGNLKTIAAINVRPDSVESASPRSVTIEPLKCETGTEPLAGVKVLLAEDGPDNQRLITTPAYQGRGHGGSVRERPGCPQLHC